MHRVAPPVMMLIVMMLALAGCGTPMRWEKPGMDPETFAKDQAYCIAAARQEAGRMYPNYLPPPVYAGYGSWSYAMWQQQTDSNRFFAQNSLARFCMRNKGYELVPQQQQPAAGTKK